MAMAGINRVSDMMRMNMLLSNVRRGNLAMSRVQQQLATGNRILDPSDDPADANSSMSLQRILEQQQQILKNIQNAKSIFNMTDQSLEDASNLLLEAQTIASANVGTETTPDQQAAAGQLVGAVLQRMLSVANHRMGDNFIFAGTSSTSVPFVSESGGIRYVGQDRSTLALLGAATPTRVGVTGDTAFGAMSSEVAGYKDLAPTLSDGIRLADLAGASGGGVRLGTIVIDDGVSLLQVDLTGADKIGEVVDKINVAGAGVITATTDPAGNLTIASTNAGADLKVTEYGSGRAAHDLGIYRPTGQGAGFSGDDLAPYLTVTTALADLADGAGLDLTSGLTITNGGHSATLEFSSDTTLGDLINRVNTAELGVRARINADRTGIDIVNTLSGSQLRIGENGGATADDLGVRSLRGATALSELNDGVGVRMIEGKSDFIVTARDGGSFEVDLDGAETLTDVIDRINAAASAAGVTVSAGLAVNGNGIELTDATGGAGDLAVLAMNASSAAEDLGIRQSVSSSTLTGDDVNGIQPGGVFAHLAQLRDALTAGDSQAITRVGARLEHDYDSIVNLRAGIGGITQGLEDREDRTEDQTIANEAMLSNLKDTDFAEAVTRFQVLQTALEGNYASGAQMLSMSLLDFLG